MSTHSGTARSPDLLAAVVLSYSIVAIVCFGAGYLIGRVVL